MTMTQVRVHGVNDVRLDVVDKPVVSADDVLIEVALCGICGSDLGYVAMGGLGLTQPMPLGHELVGKVVEVGQSVGHLSAGDRVVVNPMANANGIGNGGGEGAFAPYLLIRNAGQEQAAALKIPDALGMEEAALVEPLSVAMHGCHQGRVRPEDNVVIFGAGPIGLCTIICLKYLGVSNLVVVDLSAHRLAVAESLGATPFKADAGDLGAFLMGQQGHSELMGMPVPDTDVYIEATGAGAVFGQAVNLAKTGARLVVLGLHKKPVELDLANVLLRELNIVGSMAYPTEFPEVIAMLCGSDVDVTPLISHRFPLSQFTEALATAVDTSVALKVMIDCQQ